MRNTKTSLNNDITATIVKLLPQITNLFSNITVQKLKFFHMQLVEIFDVFYPFCMIVLFLNLLEKSENQRLPNVG